MALFNHIVGLVLAPIFTSLLLIAIGLGALLVKGTGAIKYVKWVFLFAFAWLYFWSTPIATYVVGVGLERKYPSVKVEDVDHASAIILLGGGMNVKPAFCEYPDMNNAADRVWHAARLFKCGKADKIICTGALTPLTTKPLLMDFGVPEDAIITIESPRNTEEEARDVVKMLSGIEVGVPKRILVVTSAWHMRRAMMMFNKVAGEGVEVIAAAGDYEGMSRITALSLATSKFNLNAKVFCPTADSLMYNSAAFKEFYAYWAYRLLRGF